MPDSPCLNSTTVEIAYLALGSNLGDRQVNLERAVTLLCEHKDIELIAVSSWLENPAIEEAGPYDFLNGVVKIQTSLTPHKLLDYILQLELRIDPERNSRGRKQARVIDLDILKYGTRIIKDERLELPHPRMLERDFVMKPLDELQ